MTNNYKLHVVIFLFFMCVVGLKATDDCAAQSMPTPKNGQKNCTSDTGPCTLTCDQGYCFFGPKQSLTYTCDPTGDKTFNNFHFHDVIPNCVEKTPATSIVEYYIEYEGNIVISTQDHYINVLQAHADQAARDLVTGCWDVLRTGETVPIITMTATVDDPPVDAGDVAILLLLSFSYKFLILKKTLCNSNTPPTPVRTLHDIPESVLFVCFALIQLRVLYLIEFRADDGTDNVFYCENFLDYVLANIDSTDATDAIETIMPETTPLLNLPGIDIKPSSLERRFANLSCPGYQVRIQIRNEYCIPCPSGFSTITINNTGVTCKMCPQGEYQPSEGAQQCIKCPDGYSTKSNGSVALLDCLDVNECAESQHDDPNLPFRECEHTCVNGPGSYECQCLDGYALENDKHHCKDIDECATTGLHNCIMPFKCTNTEGGYFCSCPRGSSVVTQKNGIATCTEDNVCDVDKEICDHYCKNTTGSYTCLCFEGYVLQDDGKTCVEIPDRDSEETSSGFLASIAVNVIQAIIIVTLGIIIFVIITRRRNISKKKPANQNPDGQMSGVRQVAIPMVQSTGRRSEIENAPLPERAGSTAMADYETIDSSGPYEIPPHVYTGVSPYEELTGRK